MADYMLKFKDESGEEKPQDVHADAPQMSDEQMLGMMKGAFPGRPPIVTTGGKLNA